MRPYSNPGQAPRGLLGDGAAYAPGDAAPAPFLAGPEPHGGDASLDDFFSDPKQVLRKALQIVHSRWKTGLAAALLVGAAVAGVLFTLRPIESTAVTTLLAQSPLDQILDPAGFTSTDADKRENDLINHLAVMQSRSFRALLASSFTPEEKREIQAPYLPQGTAPSDAFLELLMEKKVAVNREREQEFFVVVARHRSERLALLIADHFNASYLAYVQSQLRKANLAAAQVLGRQAADLSRQIEAIEDERRQFRSEHNLISAQENQTILEDRIKQVNLARADLRVERAKLEAQVSQARQDIAANPLPYANAVLSAFSGIDPLRQQLSALEVQKDTLAVRYGPNHSRMIEVEGDIAATEAALARAYRTALAELEGRLSLVIASERGLDVEFENAFKESLELGRLSVTLNALGQQADDKRKTLDDLFQRIGKASVDTGLPAEVLRVVDPAYTKRPLVPLLALYIAAIVILSAGTFFVVPIVLNFCDGRINENIDLESLLRLEVIGVIPRLGRTPKPERPHIVRDNADLHYVEAFMTLMSQLDLTTRRTGPRRIVVTSALPGEGKSTIAANLAAAYTRIGRRTVLVECDFRRPAQGAIHGVRGRGLLAWAKDGFAMSDDLLEPNGPVGLRVLADGTALIPAGSSDIQPARYLSSESMVRFFERLGAEFEVVIVDTPPAGVFRDALMIARGCDETVLVARDGVANTELLTRVLNDFAKTRAPAIGMILNGFSANAKHPQLGYHQLYRKYDYNAPRKVALETT